MSFLTPNLEPASQANSAFYHQWDGKWVPVARQWQYSVAMKAGITLAMHQWLRGVSTMGLVAEERETSTSLTRLYEVRYPLPLPSINSINLYRTVRHLIKNSKCMTANQKQTIWGGRCAGQISVGVDKVVDVFVSEYHWRHKTQQRVELMQVVLYRCTSQQHSVTEFHLNTNNMQHRHDTTHIHKFYGLLSSSTVASQRSVKKTCEDFYISIFYRLNALSDTEPTVSKH